MNQNPEPTAANSPSGQSRQGQVRDESGRSDRSGTVSLTAEAREVASGLADAVNRHLWSDAKGAYTDCLRAGGQPSPIFSQQTQVAALISGVASGERAKRCGAIVHDPPQGFVRAGSPFFMFFLLEALVLERRFDALADTIRDYWGKQIDAGATTFWEMYHEGGRQTRSHCHGWSAAPT
jgi:hypothetical protein